MKLKCLIVDDEPLAHEVLIGYIGNIEKLEIVGQCYSAIESINFLNKTKVDILFLDINMPELTGLEMLATLTNPPKVILTTAYSEFALESYEYRIVDYLVKPIRFSRFLKAVNRIIDSENTKSKTEINKEEDNKLKFIEVKDSYIKKKILHSDIQYIQAYGNYLKVYTNEKMYLITDTMKNFDNVLPHSVFLRIHKSFFINKTKVEHISSTHITINSKKLPIGNIYKREVIEKLS